MALLVLASYPLGLINYKIKSPLLRLYYGLIMGVVLQFTMYGWDILHLVFDTIITYLFITFFGRKVSSFWIVLITLLHLSYLHIVRIIYNYSGWDIDYTTIYMMTICKFSQLAFSYEDGEKKDEDIKSEHLRLK